MFKILPRPKVKDLATTTSTNDELAKWWQEEPLSALSTVTALHQSAGRGRGGHRWEAAPGTSILASVLFVVSKKQLTLLPLMVGLALARILQSDLPKEKKAQVKWPNDVLIEGKKVAGILAQNLGSSPWGHLGNKIGVAVGVGVNLYQEQSQLPLIARPSLPATSMALEGAPNADGKQILEELRQGVTKMLQRTDFIEEYRRESYTLGREVRVHTPQGVLVTGVATGVTCRGELEVTDRFGGKCLVTAGDTEIVGAHS